MRYPGAVWSPGPTYKQNGGKNTTQGVVCHSMVGTFAGAMSRLLGSDVLRDQASWHFSVLKDGTIHQHYETLVQCWHAGSAYNNTTIGIEHEGGYDPITEPLTVPQRDASVNLVRWLSQRHNFPLERQKGLWEHNEVSDSITQCPSGRIPWEFYTDEEDEEPSMKVVHCSDDNRIYLVGFAQPIWITSQAEVAELEKAYGPQITLSKATINQMHP